MTGSAILRMPNDRDHMLAANPDAPIDANF